MFLWITLLNIFTGNVTEYRQLYLKAVNNSNSADELVSTTKGSATALGTAYHAMGQALQAKHGWNPATKLSLAKSAAKGFDKAVGIDANDVEVRFLRFSFQSKLPSVVSITKHTGYDKSFILKTIKSTHPLWGTIKPFMLDSELLTASEKAQIKAK